MRKNPVNIFDYTDYPSFLRDFIENDAQKHLYSHLALARSLGLTQKVQVYRILQGQRKHLPSELVEKLCESFKLDSRETEYFKALVQFFEAKTLDQKNKAYVELHKIIRPVSSHSLHKKEFEFLKNWYGPVIRELLTIEGRVPTAREIASRLKPSVPLVEVEKTIELIKQLELIKPDEKGGYSLNFKKLRISRDESQLAAQNYNQKHFEILEGAQARSLKYPHRFICTTFGATKEGAAIISSKIHEMSAELTDLMSHMDKDKDQVYQFNVQLFPLSDPLEKGVAESTEETVLNKKRS
jgi:uncharacterized protein (TIGR02147 family)